MNKTAIIGGGISGIAAAFQLHKNGLEADLYEAAEQLGGRIGSARLGERWIDFGGKNIGCHYRYFREFIQTLGGMEFEHFGLNSSRVVNGRIVRIDKDGSRTRQFLQFLRLCGPTGLSQVQRRP